MMLSGTFPRGTDASAALALRWRAATNKSSGSLAVLFHLTYPVLRPAGPVWLPSLVAAGE
jgi:hypothetical protein